ncbi:MAG: 3-hydroxyacyl-CoA dehydrogenase/enoyl-CoA hydratase family protein [Deltaproteobacteria bacterium]|nr:3-hydroxyacyl-CoA dehydrogenase/enoyl-CoA hydratase family protein [Deltaproteobacteria bacterium]
MKHVNKPIDEVAVLGAGVMGAAIAAHLANAGLKVLLLDVVPKPTGDPPQPAANRNKVAEDGLTRTADSKPASFFSRRFESLVRTGNLEDDLEKAARCDVVVEAVVENLDIKRQLFARLDALGGEALIASNTSGLPLASLIEGRSAEFKKRFVVTHFFNPPRYLPLVELVAGAETTDAYAARAQHLCATVLGKGVVWAKDTPNFIANRIGTFSLLRTLDVAAAEGYTVEEVDLIFGKATGRPKSAIFRTADVVGLDTLVHVSRNCHGLLAQDERRAVFAESPILTKLVENKWLGSKTKQGFYKKDKKGDIQQLDLGTFEYVPLKKPRFDSVGATKGVDDPDERLRKFFTKDDRASQLARKVIDETLIYAANRVGEISDDISDIDNAMCWGFGWERGPFAVWDALGVAETVTRMETNGLSVPAWVKQRLAAGETTFFKQEGASPRSQLRKIGGYQEITPDPRALVLSEVRKWGGEVERNPSASVLDIGDGVFCLEFHAKMNAIDPDMVTMVHKAVDRAEREGVGLVVGNDADSAFCAGANLFGLMVALSQNNYKVINEMVIAFQNACNRLRYARVPVVCAPFGLALGGGAEIVMACQEVRAAAELYVGCVEVGVGLIPAGGGTMEMAARAARRMAGNPHVDLLSLVRQPFEYLATARVSTSAEDGRELGYLQQGDSVSMRREHVLHDAKELVLGRARAGFRTPPPRQIRVIGAVGAATLRAALHNLADAHRISEHDAKVASGLAKILSGGDVPAGTKVDEQTLLDLEREVFLSLCGEEKTRARIQHMLQTSKPLRN